MNPLPKKSIEYAVITLIIVIACILVGSGFSKTRSTGESDIYDGLQLFAEVIAKIQAHYVEEIKPKELIYGAIRGMLSTLDPYSQFMDIDQYKDLETDTKGEFTGLGIQITLVDGWLTVDQPIEGTPAFRAGIKAKDRIIKIDDTSTEGIKLEEAVKKMRGPKGTPVRLHIFRNGNKDPLIFNITRDTILLESVRTKIFSESKKIGYIRLKEFREKTAEDLSMALAKLKKDGIEAIILDLRYNPGGLLRSSIDVSDLFLPKDMIVVSTKGRAPGNDSEYRTSDRSDKYINYPMVILVNEGSASAAEIVSGCMQDHRRAILIGPTGKKTYGKGSVQSVMELRNNTAIRLTTAKYYTPNGKSIHGKGLTPDLTVDVPRDIEDSILFSSKLGEIKVPKVSRSFENDSTLRFITSDKETVEDAELVYALKVIQTPGYFKESGLINLPETKSDNTTANFSSDSLK